MDKKISELAVLSTPTVADVFVAVQGAATKQVTFETMLSKAPGPVVSKQAVESIAASGAVSKTSQVTKLTLGSALALTLAAPIAGEEGIEKIIVVASGTTSSDLVITAGVGVTTVTFNAPGDSIHLKNIDTAWYVIGSNSVTIA